MFENVNEQKEIKNPAAENPAAAAPIESLADRIERLHREGGEKGGHKGLIVAIIGLLLIASAATAGYLFWPEIRGILGINGDKQTKIEEEGVCAEDAFMCPDGSYVKRVAPNCEFAPCISPESACAGEGERIESASNKQCCTGLKTAPGSYYDLDDEECETEYEDQHVCVNCGDGQCGLGENQCNCPEDCRKEAEESVVIASSTPSEVYLKYLEAVQNGDFEAIKSLSIAEGKNYDDMTEEQKKMLLDLLKNMQAVEIKLITELIEGDRAVVIAQGKANSSITKNLEIKDAPSYGIVMFKKVGEVWKIFGDNWMDTSAQVNMESLTQGKGFSYWDVAHHCNHTKDQEQCSSLKTENEKSRCYGCFGEYNNDLSLCEKSSVDFDREKCYMEIARVNRNQSLCEKIEDENLNKMCDNAMEIANYLSGTNVYALDQDKDDLSFIFEIKFATDIDNPDTDGDGYQDGSEVKKGYNPRGNGRLY